MRGEAVCVNYEFIEPPMSSEWRVNLGMEILTSRSESISIETPNGTPNEMSGELAHGRPSSTQTAIKTIAYSSTDAHLMREITIEVCVDSVESAFASVLLILPILADLTSAALLHSCLY